MFIGNRQMLIAQEFQTLARIMEMAFGGGGEPKPKGKVVQNESDLNQFMQAFYR